MFNRVGRAVSVLRTQGSWVFASKMLDRLQAGVSRRTPDDRTQIRMLVRWEDARDADWTTPQPWALDPHQPVGDRWSTAWLMHPPGESSGGHQNIFRFIKFLEDAGHEATVYLYHSAEHGIDAPYLKRMIRDSDSYPHVKAEFIVYDPAVGVRPGTDAIFATGWETAYPAFLDRSRARRLYFVQDYEPAFYPVGSEHVLAENTYRFGFHGVTAGAWLAKRLTTEYGMSAQAFEFGADVGHYSLVNRERRREVFFYARPVTTRRGFELGVMALEHIARQRPDLTIHLAGWDVSDYDLPFEYVNHSAMQVSELNDLYNRCGVALVLSLTNLSLLPLELLAAGVIPVVNAGDNNAMVTDNPFIEYCEPSPHALAERLLAVLDREDQPERAAAAAASVADASWDAAGRQFLEIVGEALRA